VLGQVLLGLGVLGGGIVLVTPIEAEIRFLLLGLCALLILFGGILCPFGRKMLAR